MSATKRDTQARVAVIMTILEQPLKPWVREILCQVNGLLKIQQKTGIVSKESYNKLRDYDKVDRRLDFVMQKTRVASVEQVVALLDLIAEEIPGSKCTIKHFRDVLKNGPKVPVVRPQTGRNLNVMIAKVQKEAEATAVLKHLVETLIQASAESEVEKERYGQQALKEVEEANARAAGLEKDNAKAADLKKENDELRSLLRKAKETIETQKQENEKVREELNAKTQEASKPTEEEKRLRDENAELRKMLDEKTQQLETVQRQLQEALGKVAKLETKVQVLQDNAVIKNNEIQDLKEDFRKMAIRQEATEQQNAMNAMLQNRYKYNPRLSNTDLFGNSQPAERVMDLNSPRGAIHPFMMTVTELPQWVNRKD